MESSVEPQPPEQISHPMALLPKKWIYIVASTAVLIAAGVFTGPHIYQSILVSTNTEPQIAEDASTPAEYKCNPNDPKVTENVKFLEPYPFRTTTTEEGTFQVVEAIGARKEWMYYGAWKVCDKLAISISHFGSDKGDDYIYYNGNLYALPGGSLPLTDIHHQIAYKTGYDGTGIIDGKTYNFSSDQLSKVYSIGGKVAYQSVSERNGIGGLASKFKVFLDGSLLGEYAKIYGSIQSVGGQPTFVASLPSDDNTIYPTTVLVQGDRIISQGEKYIGVPNEWDGTVVDYRGKAAYVVLSEPAFSVGQYGPIANRNAKYKVVWGEKTLSDGWDRISRLVVVNDKLGIEGVRNGKARIIFDGKEYGSNYAAAGVIMDAGSTIGFLGMNSDDSADTKTYEVVRDGKVVAHFENPYVFYPNHQLTFAGDKVAIAFAPKDTSTAYVQYGDKQIFKGYTFRGVSALDNKLVVAVEDKGNQYYFIEQ